MMAIAFALSGCWILYGIFSDLGPEATDPLSSKGALILAAVVANGFWGIPMSVNPHEFIRRYAKTGVDLSVERSRDVIIVRTIGISFSAAALLLATLWVIAILGR
ncbi:hypothetical protein ANRL4_02374 [Anaerolineae bacterium]|nr:hypothetical protein ANRL4_02374 [Anaerolineae bacterium]